MIRPRIGDRILRGLKYMAEAAREDIRTNARWTEDRFVRREVKEALRYITELDRYYTIKKAKRAKGKK